MRATVNSTLDASVIQQHALESPSTIVDAERSSLLVLDPDTSGLCFEVTCSETGLSHPRRVGEHIRRFMGYAMRICVSPALDATESDILGTAMHLHPVMTAIRGHH